MERKTSHNKFLRLITLPIRALGKARDLYVKSMNGYAAKGCYGGMGGGFAASEPLPRSFSTSSVRSYSSESDDLRERIRAASSRAYADKMDLVTLDHRHRHHPVTAQQPSHQKPPLPPRQPHRRGGVPRSASVGMAKIEEDKPSDFGGVRERVVRDEDKMKGSDLFARSRSYAV